jgi:hypothetical protein
MPESVMKKFSLLGIILLSLLLGACHEERAVYDDEYVPELRRFDMIDSYDVDTAVSNAPLALSPYEYEGLFEVFWKVDSLEDYRVSLKINDRNSIYNSIMIGTTICGEGKVCDQAGSWVCEYTEDLYMNCDTSTRNVDISSLFGSSLPKTLYLLLEVCDANSDYCTYRSYPVSME